MSNNITIKNYKLFTEKSHGYGFHDTTKHPYVEVFVPLKDYNYLENRTSKQEEYRNQVDIYIENLVRKFIKRENAEIIGLTKYKRFEEGMSTETRGYDYTVYFREQHPYTTKT